MIGQNSLTPKVLVNGVQQDTISVYDRGLSYGDGVFETIAISDGKPLLWQQHYDRLALGAKQLSIPVPEKELLFNELSSVCTDIQKAVAKIILTRGVGGRGYTPPESVVPTRIISMHDWPKYDSKIFEQGVRVRVCDFRLAKQPALSGLKHLNRLEQIIARSEWTDPSIFEGLLLDQDQHVIEGTMSNLFLINGDELVTPDLRNSGVSGVLRQTIMELAPAMGYQVIVKPILLNDLFASQELFLCNSILGVCPVRQIDNVTFANLDRSHAIREYLIEESRIVTI